MNRTSLVTYDGLDFAVSYEYEGGEPAYISDFDGGHPGASAVVYIEGIALEAAPHCDLLDVVDPAVLQEIETVILRQHDD